MAKRKQAPHPPAAAATAAPARPVVRGRLNRALAFVLGSLILFGILYAAYDALMRTVPDVHLAATGAPSPARLPIVIRNDSNLFDMTDIRWRCRILHEGGSGNPERDDAVVTLGASTRLRAAGMLETSCEIPVSGDVRVLELSLEIDYRISMPGLHAFQRHAAPERFQWAGTSLSPHWTQTQGSR